MKAHEKYASDSAFLDMWIGYLEAEKFWYLQSPWPLSPHLNTTTFSGILYISVSSGKVKSVHPDVQNPPTEQSFTDELGWVMSCHLDDG